MAKAQFIYDSPEKNADLYYATRFWAPDPLLFFKYRGRKFLVAKDLEIDRARRQAQVDRVLSWSEYTARAERKKKQPRPVDIMHEVFIDHGIRHVVAPGDTSFTLVDALRKKGYRVEVGPSPFFPRRLVKSAQELKNIRASQKTVFAAMRMAHDVLAVSRIKGNRLIYRQGQLTSERLRTMINVFLLERGFVAADTIVACGRHAVDPHDVGSGSLMPHKSIIIDVFPKSTKTYYYGDATRTFCRGRAPDALKKMYAVVRRGQRLGIEMVRAGINGRKIHNAILKFFEGKGYPTGEKRGRQQGFFHGTGHGIGLELHEGPTCIHRTPYILRAGNVLSVEPGLYYSNIGGVRIEDLIVVTRRGCEILGNFPRQLEII